MFSHRENQSATLSLADGVLAAVGGGEGEEIVHGEVLFGYAT